MTDSPYILVVEDDRDTRTVIKTILGAKGYEFKEAENGRIALDMIKERTPDLILLDVMMPELSGYDVVTRLKMKPETQAIPIIMLTAKADDSDIMSGYNEYNVDYYIPKPFTPRHLINGIEVVLHGATPNE